MINLIKKLRLLFHICGFHEKLIHEGYVEYESPKKNTQETVLIYAKGKVYECTICHKQRLS